MGLYELISADMIANKICDREPRNGALFVKHLLWGFLYKSGFTCVVWYRINRWMYLKGIPGYNILHVQRQYRFANDIHYKADIGPGFHLVHFADVHITPCTIGKNVSILNGVTIGKKMWENVHIEIGDNCFIGTGAKILGGVRIGDNVTIGALTLVTNDIPSKSLVYGIPPNRIVWTEGRKESL